MLVLEGTLNHFQQSVTIVNIDAKRLKHDFQGKYTTDARMRTLPEFVRELSFPVALLAVLRLVQRQTVGRVLVDVRTVATFLACNNVYTRFNTYD